MVKNHSAAALYSNLILIWNIIFAKQPRKVISDVYNFPIVFLRVCCGLPL